MSMRRRLLSLLAAVALSACAPAPPPGVRPAPPGPLDVARGLWGDYSGLCPDDYEFCNAGSASICCPDVRGCCEDAAGPYCCSARVDRERGRGWRGYADEPPEACAASEITCSHQGETICCSRADGCCASEGRLYCCTTEQPRGYPDTFY